MDYVRIIKFLDSYSSYSINIDIRTHVDIQNDLKQFNESEYEINNS